MTDDINLLGYIVEFSIGLGGFSGIVAVFAQRNGEWAPVDRWRVTNLLIIALIPAFAAFLAMGLSKVLHSEVLVWRYSSAVLALTLSTLLYFAPAGRRKLPPHQRDVVGPKIFAFMAGTSLAILGFQIAAALGMFGRHAFAVFFYGLVTMLLLGVVQFSRIIFVRPRDSIGTDS